MNHIIKIICTMLACLTMVSCHRSISKVWVEDTGKVPASLPAVNGFKITPYEAQVIKDKLYGVRKNVQHIYADSTYYYIVDGFFGSSASDAAKNGVRIDGNTGVCEKVAQ